MKAPQILSALAVPEILVTKSALRDLLLSEYASLITLAFPLAIREYTDGLKFSPAICSQDDLLTYTVENRTTA